MSLPLRPDCSKRDAAISWEYRNFNVEYVRNEDYNVANLLCCSTNHWYWAWASESSMCRDCFFIFPKFLRNGFTKKELDAKSLFRQTSGWHTCCAQINNDYWCTLMNGLEGVPMDLLLNHTFITKDGLELWEKKSKRETCVQQSSVKVHNCKVTHMFV